MHIFFMLSITENIGLLFRQHSPCPGVSWHEYDYSFSQWFIRASLLRMMMSAAMLAKTQSILF